MRRQRHTKIVATLGPASNDFETISELFHAGALKYYEDNDIELRPLGELLK